MTREDSLPSRYQALLLAARNLFSLHNFEDLLDTILKHSCHMMQAEACSLYLPDPQHHELVIYSARGEEDRNFHTTRMPWDKGMAGITFQTRKPIRTDDAQKDNRLFKPIATQGGFSPRAMITLPLADQDRSLGVLQAINPQLSSTFTDHDQEIFEGLASIVTSALLRLEAQKTAVEEAKRQQELQLAREIQQAFLPPTEFHTPYAEVRVKYQSAYQIGGDFYASVPLPGDRLLVVVGDVSGKGIPAALTTAQVTGEINALSGYAQGELHDFVCRLNNSLYDKLDAGRFVATSFLLYDPHAATMEVICAGKLCPWRLSQSHGWEPLEVPRSLPLGIFKDFDYQATTFSSDPSEKWVLFSDGINEGRNTSEVEFGLERFQASLLSASPYYLLNHIWKTWTDFVTVDQLHDDACLVLLSTHPFSQHQMLSDPSYCQDLRQFIEKWAFVAGYDHIQCGQIILAADEACTNIIRHAYQGKKNQKIFITAEVDEKNFTLRLRDFGPEFDPECLKSREVGKIEPGGLGLHLLHLIFPQIHYHKCTPGTELVLSKPLQDLSSSSLATATPLL